MEKGSRDSSQQAASSARKEASDSKRGRKEVLKDLSSSDAALLFSNSWLSHIPLLTVAMCEPNAQPSLAFVTSQIAKGWNSDFCWASCFEPNFLAALMYEGYLPTAHGSIKPKEYILLPKLHQQRCIINFEDLHVPKGLMRRSRGYKLSTDSRFDEVVAMCLEQHSESWLHPPLVQGFKGLFRCGGVGQVRIHSIEVSHNGELVAGELGYSVGKSYCSLSGFTRASSAGSVQCVALGLLLHQRGFEFWDLGMGMKYKHQMGAKDCPRMSFLAQLHRVRDQPKPDLKIEDKATDELLSMAFRAGQYVRIKNEHPQLGGKIAIVSDRCGAWLKVLLEGQDKQIVNLPPHLLEDACPASSTDSAGDGSDLPSSLRGLGMRNQLNSMRLKGGGQAGEAASASKGDEGSQEETDSHLTTLKANRPLLSEAKVQHHRLWETRLSRRKALRPLLMEILERRERDSGLSKRGKRVLRKLKRREKE
mmetsp:Transcript_25500/g.84307  ORF Transcript_25500/g.84307 Transcript_25500/m.84307 type:complete len:477 (-) Transcript_25500:47-1477(-)